MQNIYDALADGFRYPRPEWPMEYLDDEESPPRKPLPLEREQVESLTRTIDAALEERGCDNTPRAAEAWARRAKVRWPWLRGQLEERGGYCDCEVLMNVVPPVDPEG